MHLHPSPNIHPDFVIEQEARFAMVLAGQTSDDMSLDRIFQLGHTVDGQPAYMFYLYASARTEREVAMMGGARLFTGTAAPWMYDEAVQRYSADARWARRS